MTTAKPLSMVFLLVLAGCGSKQAAKNEALAFLQAKNYTCVTRVSAIPVAAIRRITALEKDTLNICDVESGLPISLSDVGFFSSECTSQLNFALVGDSTCLLSYLQGGRGVHKVVYYLTYKGAVRYIKYTTPKEVENVAQLDSFLQKQPNDSLQIESVFKEDSSKKFGLQLTPPPPWSQKTVN